MKLPRSKSHVWPQEQACSHKILSSFYIIFIFALCFDMWSLYELLLPTRTLIARSFSPISIMTSGFLQRNLSFHLHRIFPLFVPRKQGFYRGLVQRSEQRVTIKRDYTRNLYLFLLYVLIRRVYTIFTPYLSFNLHGVSPLFLSQPQDIYRETQTLICMEISFCFSRSEFLQSVGLAFSNSALQLNVTTREICLLVFA